MRKRISFLDKCIRTLEHAATFGVLGVGLMAIFALPIRADFLGYYAVGNFAVDNIDLAPGAGTDGFASTPDSGVTGVFTGGNSGSGYPGSTTFTIAAQTAGTVMFSYLYSSLDDPGADSAGYLVGGLLTPLADTDGTSGVVSFPVISGEIFGFEVDTADNQGEPGVLNVTDFGVVQTTVPEPSSGILISLVLVGYVAQRTRRGRCRHSGGSS